MTPATPGTVRLFSWPRVPLRPLHAPHHLTEQLRRGGEIPLRVRNMRVSQKGAELRQTTLDVDTVAMPSRHCINGQSMSKIQNTRSARDPRSTQTDPPTQADEGVARILRAWARSTIQQEEALAGRMRTQAIAEVRITLQGALR